MQSYNPPTMPAYAYSSSSSSAGGSRTNNSNNHHNNNKQAWLLQEPADSGYASDDNDLFAQAFKDYPSVGHALTPVSECPSVESPFEYADSLCVPTKQYRPYDWNELAQMMEVDPSVDLYTDLAMMVGTEFWQAPKQVQQPVQQIKAPAYEPVSPAESEGRGRPRQRAHHSAVEQRYRQNLNLHFSKLRYAVPDIPTSQPTRSGQPPKPSKCEVLMGAVDYIRQLEEENMQLKGAMAGNLTRKRARTDAVEP